MTNPAYRILIAKMADELDQCHQLLMDDRRQRHPLADHARALLAEPVAPTDEEIEEWADACSEAPLEEMDPEIHGWRRCFTAKEFSETIRAALARWGRPAAAPVPEPGEVAELVADLQEIGEILCGMEKHRWAVKLTRAATLLQQQAAPVPVSERLPGPEDCDAEGRCWLGGRLLGTGTPTWLLGYPDWVERFPNVHRFWLPANALPLPAPEGGEVQQ